MCKLKTYRKELVRSSVEKTLNALLEQQAQQLALKENPLTGS